MQLLYGDEPLRNFNLLQSDDVDFSQNLVSEVYCEHSLVPVKGMKVDAKLNAVEGTKLTFGYLTYGVDAKILLPPLPPCYHVNITLAGHSCVSRNGKTAFTEGMKSGAVLLPDQKASVLWAKDAKQYALKFPREKLESHLSSLINERVDGPIDFDLTFNLQNSAGRSLLRACILLQAEWEEQSTLILSPIARRHIESLVMTNFLLAAGSPHTEKIFGIHQQSEKTSKLLVQQVKEYIEENVHELPGLAELTSYAGVSARSLQNGFKEHLGVSPMEYVRNVRMERAHEQLKNAVSTGENVTDIAMEWGFYNVGRFSQMYKGIYGQSPRETIIRVRSN